MRRRAGEIAAILLLLAALGAFTAARAVAQHLIPQLGLLALMGTVCCAILRLRLAALVWLGATAFLLAPVVPDYLPRRPATVAGCTIKVLSFNQLQTPPDSAGAARLIAGLDPDLLFVQKALDPHALSSALAIAGLKDFHSATSSQGAKELILSRYPILRVGGGDPFWVDIALAGAEVRLYGLSITRAADEGSDDPGNPALYRGDYEKILAALAAYHGPFIIAGDGNSSPYSPEMRELHAAARDAWDEGGYGLGATFPGPWRRIGWLGPFIRIDYVLHDSSFAAAAIRRVNDAAGAGHYPVLATLTFIGRGKPGGDCQ